MPFNLVLVNNSILSCFFFFFLVIDLSNLNIKYFLITAVIAQVFNLTEERVIPMGITTEVVEAKIETHPLTAEAKIRKCSI